MCAFVCACVYHSRASRRAPSMPHCYGTAQRVVKKDNEHSSDATDAAEEITDFHHFEDDTWLLLGPPCSSVRLWDCDRARRSSQKMKTYGSKPKMAYHSVRSATCRQSASARSSHKLRAAREETAIISSNSNSRSLSVLSMLLACSFPDSSTP